MTAAQRTGLDGAVKPNSVAVRPRVLVLLAAFNGANWIQEQLRSILRQENVDVHIIVRDDGSVDHTISAIEALGVADRVEIRSALAPTGSASQNFFSLIRDCSAVDFDFVAFADQDDIWNPDKVQRACSQLRSTSGAGYSSAVTAFWEDATERALIPSSSQTSADFLFESAGQGCTYVLTAKFYERLRHLVSSNRHLTESVHFHDWAIYAIARAWNLRWCFDELSTMKYRQHGENHFGARNNFVGIIKRLLLIRSGWYRTQVKAITDLCVAAAPLHRELGEWKQRLQETDNLARRLAVGRMCKQAGRRRRTDRIILATACLLGWV